MTKKVAKKGSKRRKKQSKESPAFEYEPLTIVDLGHVVPTYVRCKFCNAGMNQLDFEWQLIPTTITFFEIKAAIRQRHLGAVSDIVLYRDVARRGNEICCPDTCSLKDAGVEGIPSPEPDHVPIVKILYDFPPRLDIDPLLTAGAASYTSPYNITLKLAAKVDAMRRKAHAHTNAA